MTTLHQPENTEHNLPADTGDASRTSFWWRSHRITVIVAAWLAAVVAVAGVLVLRSGQEEPVQLAETAGSQVRAQLFVDPNSQAATWVSSHQGRSATASIQKRIAAQPTGKWFGAWSGDITSAVSQYVTPAAEQGKIPVLVAYNLPGRDCGGHSSGGLSSAGEYSTWINGFARGLDGRKAIVILEPDSLAQLDTCLTPEQQQQRLNMLSRAVDRLQSPNVWVYLDAGHSNWVAADQMAQRLDKAGVERAHGFSLNVSNYNPTSAEQKYARELNDALGMSKPYVIDTSRNGNGSQDGEWCNPSGTKLGAAPRMVGDAGMLLWVKAPGESDGACGVAPQSAAGEFVPQLATRLIKGS
jgi:endoglucanase